MREIIVFCVTILFLVLIIINGPVYAQSDASVGNTKPGAVAPDTWTPNSNLLQSELSSAPLAPCVAIPTIGMFTNTAHDSFTLIQGTSDTSVSASITFPSSLTAATCLPTTCTWTISSVPPGPIMMYLQKGVVTSSFVMIDSTTGVIPNQGSYADWFPPSIGTNGYTTIVLDAVGDWIQSGDPVHAAPYPTLQWGPFNVTLVYQ